MAWAVAGWDIAVGAETIDDEEEGGDCCHRRSLQASVHRKAPPESSVAQCGHGSQPDHVF